MSVKIGDYMSLPFPTEDLGVLTAPELPEISDHSMKCNKLKFLMMKLGK